MGIIPTIHYSITHDNENENNNIQNLNLLTMTVNNRTKLYCKI